MSNQDPSVTKSTQFAREARPLAGKHVVVTGAGGAIGRAIALRLGRDGASVGLLARRPEPLAETASALDGPGAVAACDTRRQADVDDAFARLTGELGPVHALVAAAGMGGENDDGDSDQFDDLVATNLNGTYYCCRAATRHLAPGPDARHIVVLSSILARIGVGRYTGYCASKAGLLGLVRSLSVELAPVGVQVNAICPGWVDSEMAWQGLDAAAERNGSTRAEAYRDAMGAVPLGRMSQPADVAGTVSWLLSPDARGVTGQAIDQNGGAWMG